MNGKPESTPKHSTPPTEETEPRKHTSSVLGYLAVLFAAAFLMLLLAYFIQERNSTAQIGNLRNSLETFQSVDAMIAENQALRAENAELRAFIDELIDAGFVSRSEDGSLSIIS